MWFKFIFFIYYINILCRLNVSEMRIFCTVNSAGISCVCVWLRAALIVYRFPLFMTKSWKFFSCCFVCAFFCATFPANSLFWMVARLTRSLIDFFFLGSTGRNRNFLSAPNDRVAMPAFESNSFSSSLWAPVVR